MVSTFSTYPYAGSTHSLAARPVPPYSAAAISHRPASFAIQEILGLGSSPPTNYSSTASAAPQFSAAATSFPYSQRPAQTNLAPASAGDTDFYLSWSSSGYGCPFQTRESGSFVNTSPGQDRFIHSNSISREKLSPQLTGKEI